MDYSDSHRRACALAPTAFSAVIEALVRRHALVIDGLRYRGA